MALRIASLAALLHVSRVGSLEIKSDYSFEHYKKDFGRLYADGTDEHELRESVFKQRLAEALEHNAQNRSWKKSVNHLSDLTEDELNMRMGYKPKAREASRSTIASSFLESGGDGQADDDVVKSCSAGQSACLENSNACCSGLVCGNQGVCEEAKKLDTFDWAEQLQTSHEVLEQGHCGSCWAVAAAAALNLHAEISSAGKFRKVLSPQNLLACTPNKMECGGQGGCKGATAELAFDWLKNRGEQGGLYTVDDQEYTASDLACSVSDKAASFLQHRAPPSITIKSWRKLTENSAEEMMHTLATAGPLVASIAAKSLHGYDSGVIDTCDQDRVVNHAVVMMGYGHDKDASMPYWNIRNSWGAKWGEDGFFRLQRFATLSGGEEPCGWDMEPEKGVVCKDKAGPTGKYPMKQWVCGACGILTDTAYPIGTQVPAALLETEESEQSHTSTAAKAETDAVAQVQDNAWCKEQCQHFAMPALSEHFGTEFDSNPTECSAQCDQAVPEA